MNYTGRLNHCYKDKRVLINAMLFVLMGASVSESAHAVDPSKLWLPRGYSGYSKELKQAAELADTTKRCHQVIAGTISTQHSKIEHPVFKIICRDENRKTFPWLVDGRTMDIMNKPKDEEEIFLKKALVEKVKEKIEEKEIIEEFEDLDPIEFEDLDLEMEKIENTEKIEEMEEQSEIVANEEAVNKELTNEGQKDKEVINEADPESSNQLKTWSVCAYHLSERVKKFPGLVLDTEVMPLPTELENEGLSFETAFKAQGKEIAEGMHEELSYRATCQYQDQKYTLEVYPAVDMPRVAQLDHQMTEERTFQARDNESRNDQTDTVNIPADENAKGQGSEKSAKAITTEKVTNSSSSAESEPVKIKKGDNVVDACLEQLRKKTAALDQVVWLTEKTNSRSQSADTKQRSQALAIDFDAIGPSGGELHSTGLCYFDNDEISVAIQNRISD